jgi:pyrimidine operon attenuation protein/uracil phosphoribosyltransferase
MAHEVVERNHSTESLSIIGLQSGGAPIRLALAGYLTEISTLRAANLLDVSFYRDDLSHNPVPASA